RERVARECVEEAERLRYWYGEWYARAQRLLREAAALLRTPRGEGEAMDADAMWYHWSSGHEDAALQGLRTATDDKAHRFLSMLADWQRCPKPSDHDAASALRSEAQGDAGALAAEILAELRRALEKFPGDNVTTLALVEEVGELAKATFEESRDRVREEAIQVAAMAMRVVLDGDQTLDAWRESKGLDPLVVAARPGEGGGE